MNFDYQNISADYGVGAGGSSGPATGKTLQSTSTATSGGAVSLGGMSEVNPLVLIGVLGVGIAAILGLVVIAGKVK